MRWRKSQRKKLTTSQCGISNITEYIIRRSLGRYAWCSTVLPYFKRHPSMTICLLGLTQKTCWLESCAGSERALLPLLKRIFYQFCMQKEDKDYLQFVWWDNGNLETTTSIYKTKYTCLERFHLPT